MAAHARDVNILIWTSRKSVDHKTNDLSKVHGDGTRADGRRSGSGAPLRHRREPQDQRGAGAFGNRKSNVGHAQAGYLARPTTKPPENQIYFINHRYRAFPALRLRTVVRGERPSRSIVNRTTALWSIWIVASRDRQGVGAFGNRNSNVGHAQAGYLARPGTEAPETQIYCTNHRSGAFPVLRLRAVVRGERASRSIVDRTTALWSTWMVASLIVAGPGLWIING